MAEAYLGEIRMFAGNFAIYGWQMCNGQLLPIAPYTALFSILGVTYGGNGTSTFQLPDFRGRMPVHQGTGLGLPTYVIGQNGGTPNTNILTSNLPAHSHTSFITPPTVAINASSGTGNTTTAGGSYLAGTASGAQRGEGYVYTTSPGTTGQLNAATGTLSGNLNTGLTGSNVPISIVPPYLTVTFLICMSGIYPSRN